MTVLRELGAPLAASVRETGAPTTVRRRRTALTLLVLASATLMVLDAGGPGGAVAAQSGSPLDPARSAVGAVVGPAAEVGTAAWRPIARLQHSVVAGNAIQQENARLRVQVARLIAAEAGDGYAHRRAAELDKLLKVAGASGYRMVPAQVVGFSVTPGVGDTVSLDAGTLDGVRPNMTVLAPDGLVGRVVSATSSSATVLLVTDKRSSVGARLESTMALGFITGTGGTGTTARLTYTAIDPNTKPKVGQRLVTWGSKNNSPYVPGVPIGTVTKVRSVPGALASVAEIKPFALMSSLDVVAVVTGPSARNPRDTLLGVR